jgi:hypothetical protein
VWDPNAPIGVEAWRDRPVERSLGGTADRNRTSSRLDATRNARDPSRSQFRARSGAASRGLSTAADPRLDPSNRTYLGDDDLGQGVVNDDFDRTRVDGWRDRPIERSIGGTADRSQRNSARERAPMNGRGFNNGFAQEGRDSFRGGAAGAAANPASQRRQTGFRGVERENRMELNDGQFYGSTNQTTQVLSNWLDRTARGLDRLNDRLNGRLEAETEQP